MTAFPEIPTVLAEVPEDFGPTPAAAGPDFDWNYYSRQFEKLIGDFETEKNRCKVRRDLRINRKNVEDERTKGTIASDETFIADHTIASNIERESAPYVQYLENSRRVLIFKPKDPSQDTIESSIGIQGLELSFTRGMRYLRWKLPWYRIIDSICLHGATPIEVVFDESKPLHCGIEFVNRSDLIIPLKTKNIQSAECIARRYDLFPLDFKSKATALGFDEKLVAELIQGLEEDRTRQVEFYRLWFKANGCVYICWYAKGRGTWLKKPEKLQLGIFNIPNVLIEAAGYNPEQIAALNPPPAEISLYPLFYPRYDETEVEEVLECQGRASLDVYVQEAIQAITTAVVNGSWRASGLYGSAAPRDGGDADGKAVQEIRRNYLHNASINFFNPPYPNPMLMSVVQFLSVRNSQQAGQTDFAALNRQDTEKTATELNQAKELAQALSSASISIFSTAIQEVYTLCYEIARSQALIGAVKLVDNLKLLTYEYILTPAGDTEVIERAEKQQRLMEFWPLVQGTPLQQKVFTALVENSFPSEAEDWLRDMTSAENAKTEMIMRMGHVLETLPLDELNISADQRAGLQHLLAAAQQLVAQPGNGEATPTPQQPPFPVAPASNAGGPLV